LITYLRNSMPLPTSTTDNIYTISCHSYVWRSAAAATVSLTLVLRQFVHARRHITRTVDLSCLQPPANDEHTSSIYFHIHNTRNVLKLQTDNSILIVIFIYHTWQIMQIYEKN